MASATRTVSPQALRDFAERLLTAGGFRPEDAAKAAELLVWANLRGVDSHGVLRIPRYVEMVQQGLINPAATPKVVRESGAVALIDAGLAPGATGMESVTLKAVEIAARSGAGFCVGRNVTHAGAIGYFAHRIADAGLVGIIMTASKPLMAYPGARGEAVSSNPLAIAAPSADADAPIVLDMSTAAVALGKILAARDAGRAIPEGWGMDGEGRSTTDAAQVKALLPMAGAKGAGLSLMIEVLCSLLADNPIIAPALGGADPVGFNGLAIAIDPDAFMGRERFLANVQALAVAIHGLEPAAGTEAVLLPGERGRRTAAERSRSGIPLAQGTATKLAELAARLGVEALPV
ncbi:Ldh family oxidoreductase [Aquabacter cavernae]|uniref:Ldh family oxidoreductase n=1 Tax=Aquabacter cavernae TaxID=2496029 RepID=UPI000F8F0FF7|nr:Ldh family oxidoreductase [Aquabacter cavernae]